MITQRLSYYQDFSSHFLDFSKFKTVCLEILQSIKKAFSCKGLIKYGTLFLVMDVKYKKEPMPISKKIHASIKNRLEDIFDVSYAVSKIPIESMDDFERELLHPFLHMEEPIYYRGERKEDATRRLVPTILRNPDCFRHNETDAICTIDSPMLFNFFETNQRFMSVFEALYGKPSYDNMYAMLAFAQHYLGVSPFIDFSKSLYVSLSFALKGRTEFSEDIVLYTAVDIDDDDSTQSIEEVNDWLCNYRVHIFKSDLAEATSKRYAEEPPAPKVLRNDFKRFQTVLNTMSPTAKLIDIPTNDLMRYQQGVFLLLNNFSLIDSNYLTKAVRQSFVINKYIIKKELCPALAELLLKNAPQYRYEYLLDIKRAVRGDI